MDTVDGVGGGVGPSVTFQPATQAGLPDWLPAMLQLASPALPIGAFSYSQGLEAAVCCNLVVDEESAFAWIDSHWCAAFAPRELMCLAQLADRLTQAKVACPGLDTLELAAQTALVDEEFLASRDSAEARAETMQTGSFLLRWLASVQPDSPELALGRRLVAMRGVLCAPAAFALCAVAQGMPPDAARFAWAFAWLENQVQAAVKLVPLGQSAGQRLLIRLRPRLVEPMPDRAWSFAPMASLMAMRHERQYSRLFRS